MSTVSADDANSTDGEGVWSPDIEQAFQEALLLFPPCGRRKHILQEDGGGKMYGRNELIARHILMRTGKTRTRKQVSSHIQVLARRDAKMKLGSSSSGADSNHGRPISANFTGSSGCGSSGSASATPSPSAGIIRCSNQFGVANTNNNSINPLCSDEQLQNSGAVHSTTASVYQQRHQQPLVATMDHHQNLYAHHRNNLQQPLPQHPNHHHHHHLPHHHLHSVHQPVAATPHHLYQAQSPLDNESSLFANNTSHIIANSNSNNINSTTDDVMADSAFFDSWNDRPVVTQKIRLAEFSAFLEQRNQMDYMRHTYVQIDYTKDIADSNNQLNKLETIEISEIEDKFPDLSGPRGLCQRAPTDAFYLIKFWGHVNHSNSESGLNDQNSYFGFSSHFETIHPHKYLISSTKACSYGLQVVEKVDKIFGAFNNLNGRYSYNLNRSPMCEFMIHFLKKLSQLPQATQMNSVLENFTVLQVITSENPSDVLLCLAYVFEVAPTEEHNKPHYHVYKLTKD